MGPVEGISYRKCPFDVSGWKLFHVSPIYLCLLLNYLKRINTAMSIISTRLYDPVKRGWPINPSPASSNITHQIWRISVETDSIIVAILSKKRRCPKYESSARENRLPNPKQLEARLSIISFPIWLLRFVHSLQQIWGAIWRRCKNSFSSFYASFSPLRSPILRIFDLRKVTLGYYISQVPGKYVNGIDVCFAQEYKLGNFDYISLDNVVL